MIYTETCTTTPTTIECYRPLDVYMTYGIEYTIIVVIILMLVIFYKKLFKLNKW